MTEKYKIGENGSFTPQRRKENSLASALADAGEFLGQYGTTRESFLAFCLTRKLNPTLFLLLAKDAGILDEDISFDDLLDESHFPRILGSQS